VAPDIHHLFEKHGAFIARAIERLAGRGPHVDDILQETFIVAFRKRAGFDPSRAKASTWLYGIAVNLCRRFERSRRRAELLSRRFGQHAMLEQGQERPDDALAREERAQMVHDAVHKLPFRQREVFVMFELEGMEGKAISSLLKVREGTVWTRLYHARKQFAKQIRKKAAVDA
jgi:RNA polymerase sigma factor (sigma-70 family)